MAQVQAVSDANFGLNPVMLGFEIINHQIDIVNAGQFVNVNYSSPVNSPELY